MTIRVLLYGKGIGSGTTEKILNKEKVTIEGYILDEEYINNDDKNKLNIFTPSELKNIHYDYIIICISSQFLDNLENKLISYGVPENKILYIDINDSKKFRKFLLETQEEYKKLFKTDVVNSLCENRVYEDAYICNMNPAHLSRQLYDINRDYVRVSTLELISKIINNRQVPGSVAEVGVYRGNFAFYINKLFPDRRFYLFDTFEGFNEKDIEVDRVKDFSININSQFKDTSEEFVLSRMQNPQNCIVKKGYFPSTVVDVEDNFALVSLDTDLYSPIYSGLEYFYPRLSKGGYILVHDYFNRSFEGVKNAVDDFCKEQSISIVPMSDEYGSVIITK